MLVALEAAEMAPPWVEAGCVVGSYALPSRPGLGWPLRGAQGPLERTLTRVSNLTVTRDFCVSPILTSFKVCML